MRRSTLTTGLERNVEVTFDKLYDEITSPSHIAKIRLGFKNKDKYRRPFEEEVRYLVFYWSVLCAAHRISRAPSSGFLLEA